MSILVEHADHLVSKTYMAALLLGSIALLLAMLLEVGDAPDFTLFAALPEGQNCTSAYLAIPWFSNADIEGLHNLLFRNASLVEQELVKLNWQLTPAASKFGCN